jgi:heme iron utilization protein
MKQTAKELLARTKTGTLCVLDFETGAPFGALVNVATDEDGLPLFLFSKLARHTKSLLLNPAASLLISELPNEGDALTGFRATIIGEMCEVKTNSARYLAHHPYAEIYIGFGDFSFWRMNPSMIYVVGGFGKIQNFAWS